MYSKYKTILADPPWPMRMAGQYKGRHERPRDLPYSTMTMDDILALQVEELADEGCHLWLWVTNQFLHEGFHVMERWGFKYLAIIHWIKPSGFGNYFVQRSEQLLFGYKGSCEFNQARYIPNVYEWGRPKAGQHSRKPEESFKLIESISEPPRLELFARPITPLFPKIAGWDVFGNEVVSDVELANV